MFNGFKWKQKQISNCVLKLITFPGKTRVPVFSFVFATCLEKQEIFNKKKLNVIMISFNKIWVVAFWSLLARFL